MICDGGNHGCVKKGVSAVDTACSKDFFAMKPYNRKTYTHQWFNSLKKLWYMGLIASPGMVKTEETILDIMKSKLQS